MLTNFDIEKMCQKYELPLVGVYCKDQLPELERGSYYINLQNSDEGDGTHWCLAKVEDQAIWFDPFGLPPPIEVDKWLGKYSWNPVQIQSVNTTECGWYCLFADHYLTDGGSFRKFCNSWDTPIKNLSLLKSKFHDTRVR